jgi:hypothetical protein
MFVLPPLGNVVLAGEAALTAARDTLDWKQWGMRNPHVHRSSPRPNILAHRHFW